MTNQQIFFKNPQSFSVNDKAHSTLFLLRRDITVCFRRNPNDNTETQCQALFPGTMAIMAGIDLLAKFHYGDNINKSRERFIKFAEKYIDNTNTETIYQLRNSLLHSFGLYSKDRKGKKYIFSLNQDKHKLITNTENLYSVNINILWEKFELAIEKYQKDLENDFKLQRYFEDAFSKYGLLTIL